LCPVSRGHPADLLNGPALTPPARRDPVGWSWLFPVSRDYPMAFLGRPLTRLARRSCLPGRL